MHSAIWESNDDPLNLGYDMETYTELEEKMMKIFESTIREKTPVNNNAPAAVMVRYSALLPIPPLTPFQSDRL